MRTGPTEEISAYLFSVSQEKKLFHSNFDVDFVAHVREGNCSERLKINLVQYGHRTLISASSPHIELLINDQQVGMHVLISKHFQFSRFSFGRPFGMRDLKQQ